MAAVILRPPLSDVRTYIYAADLFDELIAATGAREEARLRLTRIADNPVELRFDTPEPRSASFCGLFDYGREGEECRGWLRLVAEEVVRERSSLMDLDLIPDARLRPDGALATRLPGCSIAKTALVLAVFLLEERFPDDTWNLAEIRADLRRDNGGEVAVEIVRQLSRFLIVSVAVDGEPWGQFTLAGTPVQGETT